MKLMLKIGHRGARAYEPENTLRSFRKAIELGVDAIELDVRKTKDNELVVIHDEDLSKTTNGNGSVGELTLKEIRQFVTEKDDKIPTLSEAFQFLDKKVKILVELKETGIEKKVIDLVHETDLKENIIVISFHESVLKKIRELDTKIATGLIYVRHKNPVQAALDLGTQYLLPLYHFTHSANVKKAHDNNLKIIVWTINKADEVADFKKKGVDGIASDKPDILN